MAAPAAKLWPRWNAHDPESTASIEHSAWSEWLAAYVSNPADGVARVAYGRVGANQQRIESDAQQDKPGRSS